MNKKSNKKKKRRARSGEGRNKENFDDATQVKDVEKANDEDDLCYEVKKSDVMGRYLVASRDIAAGEVIIDEPALVVGPCADCPLICLACYKELDENNYYKCKSCKWPLCSASCSSLYTETGHTKHECSTLKSIPVEFTDVEELKEAYHAIMPLRCLLLKKSSPDKWRAMQAMEPHNELRKARGDIYPLNEKYVVTPLRKWKLDFDEDEIHTICGILEVNAFEVGSGSTARALYDRAYLAAHACVPSTTHTDVPGRARRLLLRAAVPHRAGDLMTLSYAYTLQSTLKRRAHLSHSKFFLCSCARCADPTELGSMAGSFRCPRCGAAVLSVAPLEPDAGWCCGDCQYSMPAASVALLQHRLTEEYDQIDCNDVKGFENFLYKYRNVLHNSHYLCLSAKHSLSQLYGKVPEYMIHEMSECQLKRKIEICRELMVVFDILEPGYSRLRGLNLYELHAPLMILTTRDFEKKAISKENLRKRLKEIVGYLKESAIILGFEPRHTPEGLMATAAEDALSKITTWEQIIGKIDR